MQRPSSSSTSTTRAVIGGNRAGGGRVSMDSSVEVTVIDHVDDDEEDEHVDEVHIGDDAEPEDENTRKLDGDEDDEPPISPGSLEYYRPSSAASSSRASALRLSRRSDPPGHRYHRPPPSAEHQQHRAVTPSTGLRPVSSTAAVGAVTQSRAPATAAAAQVCMPVQRLLSPTHRSQHAAISAGNVSAGSRCRPNSLDIAALRHKSSDVRQDTRIAEALLSSSFSKRSSEPSPNLGSSTANRPSPMAPQRDGDNGGALPVAAGILDNENVANRILQTFHSKDALIDELQWTLRAAEEEMENLKLENDDLREAKKILLTQWEAVVQDLNDRDQCERDRDQARQELQSLRVALDDANKALTLQSDALAHQSTQLQAAEGALRGSEQQLRDATSKIESLKFKNAKLLDELKSLAQQSDESNAIHAAAMKELQDKFRTELAEHKAVTDAHHKLSIDDQRRAEKLRDAEKSITSLREQVQKLRQENDNLKHAEHESALHVAVQRDALDISERTLTHTENVATAAVQELESLRAMLADVSSQRDELQTQVQTLRGRLEEHRAALVRADSLVSEWRGRCESTEEAFRGQSQSDEDAKASYEATISQLQVEVASCRATLENQASLLAAHKSWEQSLSQEREQLSDNVVALEDTVENVERTAAEWRAKYTRAVEQANALKHELQRRKVLHAAELRDMQALAATVAAGQSKQIDTLTHRQQSVVKRLIDAEEELGRYTERCSHAEKTLALREDDVQQLYHELQAERRKTQSLSALAAEKTAAEKGLREAHTQLQKRFAHAQEGLESSSKRLEVVQELNRHQESRVAKAMEIEKRNEELQKKLDDALRRAKQAEVELDAKKESLRNAREERTKYVQEKENLQQQIHLADAKLKQALRRSDDKHRQLLVKTEHQDTTTAALEAQMASLQARESALHSAVVSEILLVLQAVVRSAFLVVDRHRDFRGKAVSLLRRLAERYEQDVAWLHDAGDDARRRYEFAVSTAEHLRLQVASLTSTCAALEQQVGDYRRSAAEATAALAAQINTRPSGGTTTAAMVPHSEFSNTQPRFSSDAVRSACHSISQEVLGLPNGLQDLIELQNRRAAPETAVESGTTNVVLQPLPQATSVMHETLTHGATPSAAVHQPTSNPLPVPDELRDLRAFLDAVENDDSDAVPSPLPPTLRSTTSSTPFSSGAAKRRCLEDLLLSDRLRQLLHHSLRISIDPALRESHSVGAFAPTGSSLVALPVRSMVEEVLFCSQQHPSRPAQDECIPGAAKETSSISRQPVIPLRALLVTMILVALDSP